MPQSVDPTRARLASWLRYVLGSRGWTHEHLARELGVAEPTVTNIVNGRRTAGLTLLLAMHRGLHVSADQLLDADPPSQALRIPR